jgi:hypothetical protein
VPIGRLKSSTVYYPRERQVAQFADYLCYWASSKNFAYAVKKLQRSLTEIENRVKLNPLTTQCVLFSRNTKRTKQVHLTGWSWSAWRGREGSH